MLIIIYKYLNLKILLIDQNNIVNYNNTTTKGIASINIRQLSMKFNICKLHYIERNKIY